MDFRLKNQLELNGLNVEDILLGGKKLFIQSFTDFQVQIINYIFSIFRQLVNSLIELSIIVKGWFTLITYHFGCSSWSNRSK